MTRRPFYYRLSEGMRISVRPYYLPGHSFPPLQRYVFAYEVRIENISRRTAQLMRRRWLIYDSIGEEQEVVGDGVVGLQPTLGPGDVHEYQSFCVLKSPRGWMEGEYFFRTPDNQTFAASIPRFDLIADVEMIDDDDLLR
ncbi:MAG: Co2+/Mg2+ efflux protein ApaG [Chloroflexus sp.]|nr:Co2+/Mg2+ efflux protein ApaG [Chloroflexus sp.]MBO9315541.1 Co2+/Mg2+ efflux protein ApaG [Chloroflexus sp.]MBO9318140.1 Co2+/Mg2+ efflux protein ApaG [Chloroflexus sp.]MBO9337117.1 Co2+/Mg2+ efflux protein ApaG [Chloroflexus sp.]MBO9374318.1 Co2+/Mg2+ efflux protein ApaG [Chloroflexus sp.]